MTKLFWSVISIPIRTGSFAQDFVQRFTRYLGEIHDQPHLGLWAPTKAGTSTKDLSALAWFVTRDSAEYAREFIAAKKAGPLAWAPTQEPWLPYLSRERIALERLAILSPLTSVERARLTELKTSKLGDDPPEAISLAKLLSEYSSNEVRADDAYKNHVVEFSGVAGAVERGTIGGITLTIGTGKAFERPQVHCFFEKGQTDKVKALNRGDKIRVRGKVDGLLVNVIVRYCELVD